jgi:hypothetical protein
LHTGTTVRFLCSNHTGNMVGHCRKHVAMAC